jgi:hypothetical protein
MPHALNLLKGFFPAKIKWLTEGSLAADRTFPPGRNGWIYC